MKTCAREQAYTRKKSFCGRLLLHWPICLLGQVIQKGNKLQHYLVLPVYTLRSLFLGYRCLGPLAAIQCPSQHGVPARLNQKARWLFSSCGVRPG